MTVGTYQTVAQVFGNRHAGGCANMADSRRDRGEWLRVGTLPAFGQPPTIEDHNMALGGLESETLLCVRTTADGEPETVNILHASPNMGRVGAEITHIGNFMRARGFTVEWKGRFYDWVNADVLILGVDKSHMLQASQALGILTHGAGLVMGWNVLVYGLDCTPTLEPDLDGSPLLTDRSFGPDAVCMLHAHIRLRDNIQFWSGYLAHMADRIEYCIALLIGSSPHGKPAGDGRSLFNKINILADEFGKSGLRESDVDLFAHAAHLIRAVRNSYVHLMSDPKRPEQRVCDLKNHAKRFYNVAKRHGRDDLLLGARRPDTSGVGAFGAMTPFFVRLALLADRWLRECLGRCAPLPAEPPDGPDKRHVP